MTGIQGLEILERSGVAGDLRVYSPGEVKFFTLKIIDKLLNVCYSVYTSDVYGGFFYGVIVCIRGKV